MLHVVSASRVTTLAEQLADVLVAPLDDPMQTEWIAAPTLGMHRWLALELARRLGNSDPERGDGVSANITFTLPGALRRIVLSSDRPEDEPDPWEIRHLVWTVLSVLRSVRNDEFLGLVTRIPDGATWFGKSRRIADLFDRYDLHRPELIRHWAQGHDVDGSGQRLGAHALWQPKLWRAVRSAIGSPSPAERLPELINELHLGSTPIELPPRVFVFGLTTLPGGRPFIDLVNAVARHREVHLMMLDPSPSASASVRRNGQALDPQRPLFRAEDSSELIIHHPLLRSWGRPYRERSLLLSTIEFPVEVPVELFTSPSIGTDSSRHEPISLLQAIQSDLFEDRTPAHDFELHPSDHSVEIHSTYGEARQTDALRDAILRRLNTDPTLSEDDIVILCPAIDRFAPHIQTSFGPSAEQTAGALTGATPRLRYRIADRSLRVVSPLIEAFDAMLSLVSGRASSTEVLEFLSLASVRERFNFSDENIATIRFWIISAGTKWGFNAEHRGDWGLSATADSNTWQQLIDRLMYGIAIGDDGIDIGTGEVAPLEVEGSEIELAGAFARLISLLTLLWRATAVRRTPTRWADLLHDSASELFAVPRDDEYQFDQLQRVLAALSTDALEQGSSMDVDLSLAEVRQAIAGGLEGSPGRANFFRGGITISSLTPLRWLPFRVICLLGLDESLLGAGTLESDDLAAAAPMIGDRDPRAELRQSLLESVLSAGQALVITHSGHSILTNQPIPDAVALAEFKEVVETTLSSASKRQTVGQVTVSHPRQADDERYFLDGKIQLDVPQWSFDREALQGAQARLERRNVSPAFLSDPLTAVEQASSVINLADLHEFLRHPVRAFLRRRLQLHLAFEDPALENDLAIDLGSLKFWELGDGLLRARLSGISNDVWERHERARGALPVGEFAAPVLDDLYATVDQLIDHVTSLKLDTETLGRYPVDIPLSDGSRVVGVVAGTREPEHPGPAVVTFRRFSSALYLHAWLNLVVLEASDTTVLWRSTLVSRGERKTSPPVRLELKSVTDLADRHRLALDALEIVVDCYRRGMNEPLPLFSHISARIADRKATTRDWKATIFGEGPPRNIKDGYDPAIVKAFGDLSFDELMGISALPRDPPGVSERRVERYADYLFGAVARSGLQANEPEAE